MKTYTVTLVNASRTVRDTFTVVAHDEYLASVQALITAHKLGYRGWNVKTVVCMY